MVSSRDLKELVGNLLRSCLTSGDVNMFKIVLSARLDSFNFNSLPEDRLAAISSVSSLGMRARVKLCDG